MNSARHADCLVLIPAYNEEKNIAHLLQEVKHYAVDILVIDDGSKDKTVELVESLGVACLVQSVNQGKGAALRRGIEYFLNKPYKCLILMDADGQHDPKELPYFLKMFNDTDADLIVGSRMANAGSMPRVRYWTNTVMSGVLSFLGGQKIEDSQCGYRALRRRVLEKINFSTAHYEIESEMLLKASRMGFKIRSIPISCVYTGQISQINPFRDTLRFLNFLFKYIFYKV